MSPEVRKVCSHFVQEEALRDARVGCRGEGGFSTQHLSDWQDTLPTGKNISTNFISLPWRHVFIPFGCFGLFERQNKPTYVGSSKDQNSRRFDGYQ